MKNIKILSSNWIRQRKKWPFIISLLIILNCYIFIEKKEHAAEDDSNTSLPGIYSSLNSPLIKKKQVHQFSKTFVQEVLQRFERRNRRLKRKCQNLRHDKRFKIFNPNIENRLSYNKKYDLLVCKNNQKGAVTLIRNIDVINKANRGLVVKINSKLLWTEHVLSIAKEAASKIDLQDKQMIKVKNVKSKVVVVGNPLERLVQSFQHIFGRGKFHQEKRRFYNNTSRGENPSGSLNETEKLTSSFSRFLRFVLNKTNSGETELMTTTGFCSPCYINYKYIMRMETFTEDIFSLFNHLNVTEISPEEVEESIEMFNFHKVKDYLEYYRGLESSLLKKVFLYAREDLYLFEYDVPDIFIKHLDYHDLI